MKVLHQRTCLRFHIFVASLAFFLLLCDSCGAAHRTATPDLTGAQAIVNDTVTKPAIPKITRSSGMFYTIDLLSPQIEGKTVTFRLQAPDAKEVFVDGDFLPGNLRPAKMEKNEDGVWEFKYEIKFGKGLFSYVFLVDKLRFLDPSNINIIRNDTQYYNYFIFEDERFVLGPDTPKGSILHTWYHSPSLNMDRRLAVYLPSDYFSGEPKNYKVLYLLHGMGGDEDSWLRFGRMQQILNYLIGRKMIEPLIVVMPNGNVDVDAAPGESAIGYNVPDPYLPHTMDGAFEKTFGEIIDFVDANFQTEASKKGRMVAGYSMGGLNALWVALDNPDKFSSVGLFSPALGFDDPQIPEYSDFEKKMAALTKSDFNHFVMMIGMQDFLADNFNKMCDKIVNSSVERSAERGYSYRTMKENAADPQSGFKFSPLLFKGEHVWSCWRNFLYNFLLMTNE